MTQDNSTPAQDTSADRSAIDRRKAMKIALGGAAAATVWSAPRIEGLSLAPDYAAAASCTNGSATFVRNSTSMGANRCFGTATNTGCDPASYSTSVNAGTKNFNLNGNFTGPLSGGAVNLTVGNIDPPFQSCTVNVNGTCSQGAFTGGGTFTFTDNTTQMASLRCNSQNANTATVTLNIACMCNNT